MLQHFERQEGSRPTDSAPLFEKLLSFISTSQASLGRQCWQAGVGYSPPPQARRTEGPKTPNIISSGEPLFLRIKAPTQARFQAQVPGFRAEIKAFISVCTKMEVFHGLVANCCGYGLSEKGFACTPTVGTSLLTQTAGLLCLRRSSRWDFVPFSPKHQDLHPFASTIASPSMLADEIVAVPPICSSRPAQQSRFA